MTRAGEQESGQSAGEPKAVSGSGIGPACGARTEGRIPGISRSPIFVSARLALTVGWALLAAGCVQAPPVQAPVQAPAAAPAATGQPVPTMSPAAVTAEAEHLRMALAREVPHSLPAGGATDRLWIERAKAMLDRGFFAIGHPQMLVVVDRNPRVQQMRIVLAQPPGAPWQIIGGSKVSTGQAGRRYYYITPTGVFPHTDGILDYRALGTFNENHIRGLGLKGMRVWDFGWQTAHKGWRDDREPGDIRLLMHATDPDYLEQRLGRPASQGCVRVPAAMNRFLDLHGVLDADYEQDAATDPHIHALLLPDRRPSRLAGNTMVVIDSSQPN